MKRYTMITAVCASWLLAACAPSIQGTITLVDANNRPIPAAVATPEGAVVNMINTTEAVEKASSSVTVGADGKFESAKDAIQKGSYKVEITHLGYQTETRNVEVGTFSSPKLDVNLRRILENKRKSLRGSRSDEDKIVNPGEVNIQPPSM